MTCVLSTVTEGTTEEPAKMATLKFPCGALIFYCAELLLPAGFEAVLAATLVN